MPQTTYKGALPTVKRKKSYAKPTSSNNSGIKDKVRHLHEILCFFSGVFKQEVPMSDFGICNPKTDHRLLASFAGSQWVFNCSTGISCQSVIYYLTIKEIFIMSRHHKKKTNSRMAHLRLKTWCPIQLTAMPTRMARAK